MLVKNGALIMGVFQQGFEDTTPQAWEFVAPQLFARLSHPHISVRRQLASLLGSIAIESPEKVAPRIVEKLHDKESLADDHYCYLSIRDRILTKHATMYQATEKLTSELCRAAVLWEEKWLDGITRAQLEGKKAHLKFRRILKQIDQSIGDEEKRSSIQHSYSTLMKPIIYDIQQQLNDTINSDVSSPYAKSFHMNYFSSIHSAIESLCQDQVDIEGAKSAWLPLKEVNFAFFS